MPAQCTFKLGAEPAIAKAAQAQYQPQALHNHSVLHIVNGKYSGETPEYLVRDNKITIKISDGQSTCIPTDNQLQRDTSSGLINYHYLLAPNSKHYISFLRDVGTLIAQYVFHKGINFFF